MQTVSDARSRHARPSAPSPLLASHLTQPHQAYVALPSSSDLSPSPLASHLQLPSHLQPPSHLLTLLRLHQPPSWSLNTFLHRALHKGLCICGSSSVECSSFSIETLTFPAGSTVTVSERTFLITAFKTTLHHGLPCLLYFSSLHVSL